MIISEQNSALLLFFADRYSFQNFNFDISGIGHELAFAADGGGNADAARV
jgi:hypothetical protein